MLFTQLDFLPVAACKFLTLSPDPTFYSSRTWFARFQRNHNSGGLHGDAFFHHDIIPE